ncbi:MAG: DUF3990 domain-containing protein [Clostridiaceae bacterium]
MIIYHGSPQIVKHPELGNGKPYNDYGQGFYCTRSLDLAKEWACSTQKDGFVNKYISNTEGLDLLNLSDGRHHILNWLALLLKNRTFDLSAALALQAREYIIQTFMPDMERKDFIIGYRADDSYFSFAEDYVSGALSLCDLDEAMRLGALGEQVVLISPKAFKQISFEEYEAASYQEYHIKRISRDNIARQAYPGCMGEQSVKQMTSHSKKKDLKMLKGDLFVLDILREEMKNDDPRIQRILPE